MKKISYLLMIYVLMASIVLPQLAEASAPTYTSTTETVDGYEITITEDNLVREVTVTKDEEIHQGTLNLFTNELIIDGNLIPQEVVNEVKALEKELSSQNLNNDLISPLNVDPGGSGGGGNLELWYILNVDFDGLYTLSNIISLTIGVAVTIITTVAGTSLTTNLISTIGSFIVSALVGLKVPSLHVKVEIYKPRFNPITGSYSLYYYYYSDKARKNLIKTIIAS